MRFLRFAFPLLGSFSLAYAGYTGDYNGVFPPATQITVTSKDGTPIWAEAAGNIGGPHVLMAHGLACTHNAFDPLFYDLSLRATLYMVRYDVRGHGHSGKPATPDFYTSDRFADDVKALIDGFNLNKPFFVGWSLAGAIAADIATNFPHPLPFSGLIWLSAIPYLGDILPKIATPEVLGFFPGLENTDDVSLGLQTRINFVESLSAVTDQVPPSIKSGWVGSTAYMPPTLVTLALSRTQNATRLLQEGAEGWPLLILTGTKDLLLKGSVTIDIMQPLFKHVTAHQITGGGHMAFYDNTTIVAQYMSSFIFSTLAQNLYP